MNKTLTGFVLATFIGLAVAVPLAWAADKIFDQYPATGHQSDVAPEEYIPGESFPF